MDQDGTDVEATQAVEETQPVEEAAPVTGGAILRQAGLQAE